MNAREALQLVSNSMDSHPCDDSEVGDALATLAACVKALEALMRPDGHYIECPCTDDGAVWGRGHRHMPKNLTVALCEQVRAALKGEL